MTRRPAPPVPKPSADASAGHPAESVLSEASGITEGVTTADMPPLEAMISYNLRRADVLMHQHFTRLMRPLKLREVEYSVLLLAAQTGGLSQRALCERLLISPPNMVGVLTGLQQRTLIERITSTSDRRVRNITLTPQGQALLAKSVIRVRELDRLLTASLTDIERGILLNLLLKLWQPTG